MTSNPKTCEDRYEGLADPIDRFQRLLARYGGTSEEIQNAIRVAWHLGREEGHLEAQYAEDYESNV